MLDQPKPMESRRSNVAEILGAIARIRIPLPAVRDIGALLETVHDHRLAASLVGRIQGPADVGKSTGIELALAERPHIKAVVVNLTSRASSSSISSKIAAAIPTPGGFNNKVHEASSLLARQFRLHAIDMLVIDGAEKLEPREEAEWVELLAGLVLRTNAAIVLCGRHRNIQSSGMLAHALGRQQQSCEVHAFPAHGDDDLTMFKSGLVIFAASLATIVGPPFNPLELQTPDMAARLLLASKGRIRDLSLLVQAGVREALLSGERKLTRLHFEEPWRRLYSGQSDLDARVTVNNPFSGRAPGIEEIRKSIEFAAQVRGSHADLEPTRRGPGRPRTNGN